MDPDDRIHTKSMVKDAITSYLEQKMRESNLNLVDFTAERIAENAGYDLESVQIVLNELTSSKELGALKNKKVNLEIYFPTGHEKRLEKYSKLIWPSMDVVYLLSAAITMILFWIMMILPGSQITKLSTLEITVFSVGFMATFGFWLAKYSISYYNEITRSISWVKQIDKKAIAVILFWIILVTLVGFVYSNMVSKEQLSTTGFLTCISVGAAIGIGFWQWCMPKEEKTKTAVWG